MELHRRRFRISFSWMDALLLITAFTIVAYLLHLPEILVFLAACVGLIPLASKMGKATESLAEHTGPKVGGFLNATLGNAAELIITLAAIRAGLLEMVKASITGSIIGNLLLVLGISLFLGGAKCGTQRFSREATGRYATLLVLSVIALCIPSLFSQSMASPAGERVEYLSLGTALLMIAVYVLGMVYSFRAKETVLPLTVPPARETPRTTGVVSALAQLALATVGVVLLSEILVEVIEPVVKTSGVSEFFLGIVLVPVIGNVAEHLVAVEMAIRNKVELSLEIALGSSLQIALFVAPLLVFLSLLLGHNLDLVFNQFELIALLAGIVVTALICSDGESNWLEGSVLLAVYAILAFGFFLLPVK